MSPKDLTPAGGIIATLISPFLPPMVVRVLGLAREVRFLRRIVDFILGTQEQVEEAPWVEVSITTEQYGQVTVRVQGGLLTENRLDQLIKSAQDHLAEFKGSKETLEQILSVQKQIRDEARRDVTYTLTL